MIYAASLVIIVSSTAAAQQLPHEDVIDVPARGSGLTVSNVFQSNMVLQRGKPIVVWGWTKAGQNVRVVFGDHEASAMAKDDGHWEVRLPEYKASAEPRTFKVESEGQTLKLDNVLVGDVWVLGGQSNMEFELAKVENGPLEIVSANYPQIRILTVPYGEGPEPIRNFPRLHEWSSWFGRHFRKGDWNECTPEVARELSAIGYVFGRRLHQAAQVPIGVIDVSRGGTTVETWTPLSVLRQLDSETTQAKLSTFDTAVAEWDAEADLRRRIEQHEVWLQKQADEGKKIPKDRQDPPTDLRPGPIADHNYPGNCYAGMIAPLEGLSVRGVIFHQGYNNAFDGSLGAEMYADVFPAMIQSWRTAFQDDKLPFGILSLCTDGYPQTRDNYCEKMFDAGIEIRAAQYRTFLHLSQQGDQNIGFASTYDLRRRWYHPQVKIPAGERIARWALATQYGFDRELQWRPPMLVSYESEGASLILTLDQEVGDPEDGSIEGFAISGDDGRYQPADVSYLESGKDDRGRVRYDRRRLVLTSPMVAEPRHFRYGWGRNPLANLQAVGNKDLPFATQKSDDWRMSDVPLESSDDIDRTEPLSRRARGQILNALRERDRQRRVVEAKLTIEADGR
ncbi:MAG: sialate O-acetylesterase [Fuerstiella sp.]